MQCDNCQGVYITGMVGMTPWPAHVCPDGTEHAKASFYEVTEKHGIRQQEATQDSDSG